MKVFTRWPGLVAAIRRAGHEPVLVDSEAEPAPVFTRGTFPGDLDRMPSGHTRHCEARQKYGDGECECRRKQ